MGEAEEFDSPVASVHRGAGVRVEESIIIRRPVEEVFRFWRNFENLPRFMNHVESVKVLDGGRSHWVVKGPAGLCYEWEAEIHNEKENELIAWRSTYGEINHAGSVRFRPVPGGEGTEVIVELLYEPPGGKLGDMIVKLVGDDPSQQVKEDLTRFKEVMEHEAAPSPSSAPGDRAG